MQEHANTRVDAGYRSDFSPPSADGVRLDISLEITEFGNPQILGLRVCGCIDLSNHNAWERALRQAAGRGGEVHLDLAGLEFIDSRGAAVLVDAGNLLTGGHYIVVHHAPPCFHRVMQVLWPEGVSTIMIEPDARRPLRPSTTENSGSDVRASPHRHSVPAAGGPRPGTETA